MVKVLNLTQREYTDLLLWYDAYISRTTRKPQADDLIGASMYAIRLVLGDTDAARLEQEGLARVMVHDTLDGIERWSDR